MLDNILLALQALKNNKMRSLLTMLGIIIGISSVITITTVGDSLTASVNSTMEDAGANSVSVSIRSKEEDQNRLFSSQSIQESDYISDEMIEDFYEVFDDEVDFVSLSENVNNLSMKANDEVLSLSGTGINYDYQNDSSFNIVNGMKFSQADIENGSNVVIIEEDLAELLFSGADPIGQKINIYSQTSIEYFYVVGVSESQDDSMMAAFSNTETYDVFLPISKAKEMTNAQAGYSSISVSFNQGVDMNLMQTHTEEYFQSYYVNNDYYTASVGSISNMFESMTELLETVELGIAAIAAISLLVGGIGVMNIMLVSITERTREIGTRKALGAPKNDIMLQFVTEAVIICMIGGIIGAILGISLGMFAAELMGFPGVPSVIAIVVSVAFSMVVGLFFGYYPASKAAKLDPIEALRYE